MGTRGVVFFGLFSGRRRVKTGRGCISIRAEHAVRGIANHWWKGSYRQQHGEERERERERTCSIKNFSEVARSSWMVGAFFFLFCERGKQATFLFPCSFFSSVIFFVLYASACFVRACGFRWIPTTICKHMRLRLCFSFFLSISTKRVFSAEVNTSHLLFFFLAALGGVNLFC